MQISKHTKMTFPMALTDPKPTRRSNTPGNRFAMNDQINLPSANSTSSFASPYFRISSTRQVCNCPNSSFPDLTPYSSEGWGVARASNHPLLDRHISFVAPSRDSFGVLVHALFQNDIFQSEHPPDIIIMFQSLLSKKRRLNDLVRVLYLSSLPSAVT